MKYIKYFETYEEYESWMDMHAEEVYESQEKICVNDIIINHTYREVNENDL